MAKSTFKSDRPSDSLGFLLWQTNLTWQRQIKSVVATESISHSQFVILACLLWFEERAIEPTQAMLVELSKIDKMTISTSLKAMVSLGLVERMEHKQDTRAKSVVLKIKGRKLAHTLIPKVEAVDTHYFGHLSLNDQRKLVNLLQKLITPVDLP